MYLRKHKLLSITLALTFPLLASADEPIIVTADRIKSSLETSPSDIKVFETEQINKATSITELLNNESDLNLVQSGPMGSSTSLFLRGTDSSHTLVVIDGIIMNDPSNPNRQFDLGRLSLNNVERIEILKGSQGLLYGSNAIGGVIVITTKKAQDKDSGSALVDYGTYNTFNAALNAQKKINRTSLSMGIDHFKTRGFSAANVTKNPNADDDGEKRTTLSSAINHELTANDELVFNYRYVTDTTDLDKGGGAGADDVNDSQFTEQQFMKAGYNHKWSNADTQFSLGKSKHHRTLNVRSDSVNPQANSVISTGDVDTISINHTQYTTDNLTQNINLDYQHEEDQLRHFNENLSFFLYNRFEYGPAVVNLGARVDSNKYFGEHVTYKLAVMHFFSKFTLKMSYSTGFRAPSLNQLFDPTYGNKNLKPEESQSADMSFDIPLMDKTKYLGTIFYTELNNRLSYDPNTFVNQNRGRARIVGFENNLSVNLTEQFDLGLFATWLTARDITAKQKLARRPNLNSKAVLSYKNKPHFVSLEANYNGRRPDVDNQGIPVEMPAYLIFHVNYDFDINERLLAYLKIKNIFDREYEEVYGYGTGGRMLTFGLKYNF